MKTRKLNSSVVILAFVASGAMFSCVSEDSILAKHNKFYETDSQKTFSLEDQAELNRLASALARETSSITILEDAEVVDLADTQGEFKAISVKYQIGNRITRMVVPLTEVSSNNTKSTHTYYTVPAESCVMKFTATNAECAYEIIERCKSLKGTGIESCTSVAFNSFKISHMNVKEAGGQSTTVLTLKGNTVEEMEVNVFSPYSPMLESASRSLFEID